MAFERIAELGVALGIEPLNEHEACWEHKLDEHWSFAVNGHQEPKVSSLSEIPIDPFTAYITWNGWPWGLITPAGGHMGDGTMANEGTFVAALEAAIARASKC